MSWDIDLADEKGIVQVPNHEEGGTYVAGGTTDASLNVTYNYGKIFDFKQLDGLSGQEAMSMLEQAVKEFGTLKDNDYWNPTKGNVGYACGVLLAWAKLHPNAIFKVV